MIDNVAASHIISNASRIVTIWSPWWIKFINQIDFVYKDENPASITGFSSMAFVVSKKFLQENNLMDIAIRLEFALQQSVRDMDKRAEYMRKKYPHVDMALIGLAESLEINSDIQEKFSMFSQSEWELLVSRSIDKSYIKSLNLEKAPKLSNDSWTSDDFDFPYSLRAEKYLELLIEEENNKEQEWLDSNDNQRIDDTNTNEDSEEENQKASNKQSTNSDQSGNQNNNVDNSNTITQSEGKDSTPNSNETSSGINNKNIQNDENEDDHNDLSNQYDHSDENNDLSNQYDHSDENNDLNNKESSTNNIDNSDGDNDIDGLSNNTSENNANNNDLSDLNGETDINSSNTNISPLEGNTVDNNSILDDLKEIDIDDSKTIGASSYQSFTDSIKHSNKKNNFPELQSPNRNEISDIRGKEPEEREDIKKQLAEDIEELGDLKLPSGKSLVTTDFQEWKSKKLLKPKSSWKKIFPKMINPIMSRAQMSGQSDMSYAKRNPNQIEGAPLLMGFISYPPEVTVLIDASPSMMKYKNTTMREFIGVVKDIFIAYAQPVTIALADSGIKYALSSMTPYSYVLNKVSRTYNGSSVDFGDTIAEIMKKGVKWGKSSYPKPDVLVVFTDGIFEWPFPEKSTISANYAHILIVSTKEYEELKPILPAWVKNKKNFISTV